MVVRSDQLADLRAVLEEAARDLTGAGEDGGYSLLDHMLQCADRLVQWRPGDWELAVAGLVHDIGHVLARDGHRRPVPPDGGEDRHGQLAADYVRPLLGERVATLVELHVPAKRYLVAVADGYADQLSAASAASLVAQGRAMTVEEQRRFEAHPAAADAVLLRKADDQAKRAGRVVPGLDAWWPALEASVSVG